MASRENTVFSQSVILDLFSRYIQLQVKRNPKDYREEDVRKLLENLKAGHCSGLSALWLIYKNQGREQVFFEQIKKMLDWDGLEKSLTENNNALIKSFEETISQIRWLQEDFSLASTSENL